MRERNRIAAGVNRLNDQADHSACGLLPVTIAGLIFLVISIIAILCVPGKHSDWNQRDQHDIE